MPSKLIAVLAAMNTSTEDPAGWSDADVEGTLAEVIASAAELKSRGAGCLFTDTIAIATPGPGQAARMLEDLIINARHASGQGPTTFPDVNALNEPEVVGALHLAHLNRDGIKATHRPAFDARLDALEDRLRRLQGTRRNRERVDAAIARP